MKIPPIPPPWRKLILEQANPPRLMRLGPLVHDRYMHWDELRNRTPPDGLSHEVWWAGVRFARLGLLKPLPFKDKHDRPIQFGMTDPVMRLLHAIDQQAAGNVRMESPIASGEDRDRYLVSSLIEEAITSSQLEGAATTREEAKAMLRSGRHPRDRSERMILNNYYAMEAVRELRDLQLTPDLALYLHRILTEDTLDGPDAAGRLREPDERINVVTLDHTTVLHEPPAADTLPERIERLCRFANGINEEGPFIHPVIRAILLHYMLAYDHPFVDGNGRTARALFYWSLARSGYWLMEYVSISRLLRQAPAKYARAYLYSETDENDTTYFIIHQLEVIKQAILALHEYLARKTAEQRDAENLLRHAPELSSQLNYRQIALLTHALRHPGHGYTTTSHKRSHRVTTQTARTDLDSLVCLGLLDKGKRGRAFVFYAPEDLRELIEQAAQQHRARNL
jgi:Fic family protein